MKPQELRNLYEAYSEVYQEVDEEKLPGDDLFNQMFRGNKKTKGLKTPQPGQNRYLAKQNQKRSAANYAAHMGKSRVPSYDSYGEQVDVYDIILSYLISEGYADTNEEAFAIMANMSEEWRQSIVEAKEDEGLSPLVKRQTRNDRIRSEVSSSDPEAHTEPELENSRRVMHKAMRGQKKPEAKSRPTGPGKYGAMQRRGMGVSDKFRKEVLKRKLN